jgi:hypothetical protein
MNRAYAEGLIPLLLKQPYIGEARIWQGEQADYNLNWFRGIGFPLDKGDIARYYSYVFKVCPRTWEPWLTVDPDESFRGMILVNRTMRYRNPQLCYRFLRHYESKIIFLGLPEEYRDFRRFAKINVPHHYPKNFYEIARAIAACKLFIGNQSSAFAIAEALKIPRCLEVFCQAPNCQPNGENGYQVISQGLFETIVADLAK